MTNDAAVTDSHRGASQGQAAGESVSNATVPGAVVTARATAAAVEEGVTGAVGTGDATVATAVVAAGATPAPIEKGVGGILPGRHAGIARGVVARGTAPPMIRKTGGHGRGDVTAGDGGGQGPHQDGQGNQFEQTVGKHGDDLAGEMTGRCPDPERRQPMTWGGRATRSLTPGRDQGCRAVTQFVSWVLHCSCMSNIPIYPTHTRVSGYLIGLNASGLGAFPNQRWAGSSTMGKLPDSYSTSVIRCAPRKSCRQKT